MDQAGSQTETTPSGSPGAGRGKHPNSLKNLRPPWQQGLSGNPSGLRKDGQAPAATKLRASLLARLERPGTMDRVAARWLSLAMKGSYPHLQAILERLDPIEKDQLQGKTILEGLKLELTPGGASLTMGRASTQAIAATDDASPREVQAEPSSSGTELRENE